MNRQMTDFVKLVYNLISDHLVRMRSQEVWESRRYSQMTHFKKILISIWDTRKFQHHCNAVNVVPVEERSELCQTSKMDHFEKILNGC